MGIGSSVYNFAHPYPGAGAWWCGMITVLTALLGCFGSGHVVAVSFTFFFSMIGVVLNIIALCIDGPRLAEFTVFQECCNLAGVCLDTPQAVQVGDILRAEREGAIKDCLNKPRDFFYPHDPENTDPLPNIACASRPFQPGPDGTGKQFVCNQIEPGHEDQNIYYYHVRHSSDISGIWETWAPQVRAGIAFDIICLLLCLLVWFMTTCIFHKKCTEPGRNDPRTVGNALSRPNVQVGMPIEHQPGAGGIVGYNDYQQHQKQEHLGAGYYSDQPRQAHDFVYVTAEAVSNSKT